MGESLYAEDLHEFSGERYDKHLNIGRTAVPKTKYNAMLSAEPCVCRRTAAGELKVGIVEEGLGLRPRRLAWLSANEVIARFGVEAGRMLIERAKSAQEDT